jgi:hypothetical protein
MGRMPLFNNNVYAAMSNKIKTLSMFKMAFNKTMLLSVEQENRQSKY